MNALNARAITVTRVLPPLVVDIGRHMFAWIERGHGFILHTASGTWAPIVDAEGIGGTVLKPHQVVVLVGAYGRPTLPYP